MVYTKELEDYVTTLEQSKRLMEMGIDYKTKFVWYIQLDTNNKSIRLREKAGNFFDVEKYPAFLPNELWEIFYNMDESLEPSDLTEDLYKYIMRKKTTESGIVT